MWHHWKAKHWAIILQHTPCLYILWQTQFTIQINVFWQLLQLFLNIRLMVVKIYTICFLLWRSKVFLQNRYYGSIYSQTTQQNTRGSSTHMILTSTIYTVNSLCCARQCVHSAIFIFQLLTINMKDSHIGFTMNYVFVINKKPFLSVVCECSISISA